MLLIEDAQYGDAGLLDFVDHLVDWARDAPIFVLVFTRPELDQSRPGFGTGRNRSTLTLDPLDDASMDALIDALVPDMPADARGGRQGQAEGIPLFAVETVRSLVDRDIVVPRDGVYRFVGTLGALSVPDGLRALLAARLDALNTDLRALVAEAAVSRLDLPRRFPRGRVGPTRGVGAGRAGRAAPPRGALDQRRSAVTAARGLPFRPGPVAPGGLRHHVTPRPQGHVISSWPRTCGSPFRADGDEVAEVISRHYLDALDGRCPTRPTWRTSATQAIDMLVRVRRAIRACGASRAAASSYVSRRRADRAQRRQLGRRRGGRRRRAMGAAPLARGTRLRSTSKRALVYAEQRRRPLRGDTDRPGPQRRVQAMAGDVLAEIGPPRRGP